MTRWNIRRRKIAPIGIFLAFYGWGWLDGEMKRVSTWVIVALSLIVLAQVYVIFSVWPPEYTYLNATGDRLYIRVHRGDSRTEMFKGAEGWVEAK